jgi:uncharacterized membrane protein YfcA
MEVLVASALIVLFAYFARGITGFGSGLIAVPLLAHLHPLTFVVPLILITDVTASVVLGGGTRRAIRWPEIKALMPGSLVGIVVGVTLLINLPRAPLLAALGIIVLAFGVRSGLNIHGNRTVSRWWAGPAGFAGGTIGALFGTGGPPYVIYLTHRLRDKGALRATFSGLFLLDGGMRVVTFLVAGLFLQPDLLWAVLAALPLMGFGIYLGHRVHIGISQTQMQRVIGLLLVASGTSLLWKAWG